MALYEYRIQFKDLATGQALFGGGKVKVVAAGTPTALTVKDETGAAIANPVTVTAGTLHFFTDDDAGALDLYGLMDSGVCVRAGGLRAGGPAEIAIDGGAADQVLVIPFDIADTGTVMNSETDTGFDLPANVAVAPLGAAVQVETADSGETIDVGLLSSEASGDADGFLASLALDATGLVPGAATVTDGASTHYHADTTLGALLADFEAGTDADTDEGVHAPKLHVGDGTTQSISFTLSDGSDTAAGFIRLPLMRPGAL